MAAKAAELQREVRENAEDYQNYLKDLYGWEKEIKVKDEMLKKGSNSSIIKNEVSIRNPNLFIFFLCSKLVIHVITFWMPLEKFNC